jgi:hypothetical protein
MANDRTDPARIDTRGSTLRVPRSRGALSGTMLVLLGIWGAAIPFVGPLFSFAFTPDKAWTWTAARGWLEVLPGAVTVLGGLILLASANRVTASFGAWLGVAGGAWFIVGPQLAGLLHIGSPGTPASTSSGLRALESLAFFYGLGALIVFFAAGALGRLSVLGVRDVQSARRREAAAAQARAADDRAAARRVERSERDRSAGSREARQREDVQNDAHAHRHFGFRRGASTDQERSAQSQDPGYQPSHLDERSSGASPSSNER